MIANGVDRARFTRSGHVWPQSGWQVRLDAAAPVTARRPLADAMATDPRWASYFNPDDRDLARLVWVGKFTQMKGFDQLHGLADRLRKNRARLLILLGHGQVPTR